MAPSSQLYLKIYFDIVKGIDKKKIEENKTQNLISEFCMCGI